MWFVLANLPIGLLIRSALLISFGENGTIPLVTLALTTITSMQIQKKQASRPLYVHTTVQPSSNITVCKMYSSQYQSVKQIKRVELATSIKKKTIMSGQRVRGDSRREVHHGVLCAQLLRHHGQQGRLHHPHWRGHDAQVHHLRRWAVAAKLCSDSAFFSVGESWHFGTDSDPDPRIRSCD